MDIWCKLDSLFFLCFLVHAQNLLNINKRNLFLFNEVFRRFQKTLIIKMMNFGRRMVGRAGGCQQFVEHNSTSVRNISRILGRIIEQVSGECWYKNDNSAYLRFLIMSLIHIYTSFLFPGNNSATIWNILMILGRIIEQVRESVGTTMTTLLFLVFKLCPPIHIFTSFLFSDHNCGTIRNILMIHIRIIGQVSVECHMQEWLLCWSSFSGYVPWPIFLLHVVYAG